jgi:hypothetical protein
MNAQTYLMVTSRLAYYEEMQKTAPERIERTLQPKGPRRRQGLFRRERPVILLQPGNQNA